MFSSDFSEILFACSSELTLVKTLCLMKKILISLFYILGYIDDVNSAALLCIIHLLRYINSG